MSQCNLHLTHLCNVPWGVHPWKNTQWNLPFRPVSAGLHTQRSGRDNTVSAYKLKLSEHLNLQYVACRIEQQLRKKTDTLQVRNREVCRLELYCNSSIAVMCVCLCLCVCRNTSRVFCCQREGLEAQGKCLHHLVSVVVFNKPFKKHELYYGVCVSDTSLQCDLMKNLNLHDNSKNMKNKYR